MEKSLRAKTTTFLPQTHDNNAAAAALRAVGFWCLSLPRYAQISFHRDGLLKAHMRRIGASTFDQIFNALTDISDLCTHDKC